MPIAFGYGAFGLNLAVHFLPFVQWSDNVFHNNFFAAWFTGVTVTFYFAAQVHQIKTLISRQALCHKKPGAFSSTGFALSQLIYASGGVGGVGVVGLAWLAAVSTMIRALL